MSTQVAPPLDALRTALDLSDAELRSFVLGAPQVLGLAYDVDVAPRVDALLADYGGSVAEARAEVVRRPAALGLEVRGSKRGSST